MSYQQSKPSVHQPSPARKKHRYSPLSMLAAPLGLPIALTLGKAIGEAIEGVKLPTITAECGIGVVFALVFAVTINYFFGKEVEVAERRHPDSRRLSRGVPTSRCGHFSTPHGAGVRRSVNMPVRMVSPIPQSINN